MTTFEERYEQHLEDRVKDKAKATQVVLAAMRYVRNVCDAVIEQLENGRVVDRALFGVADGLVIYAQNALEDESADEIGDGIRLDIQQTTEHD